MTVDNDLDESSLSAQLDAMILKDMQQLRDILDRLFIEANVDDLNANGQRTECDKKD